MWRLEYTIVLVLPFQVANEWAHQLEETVTYKELKQLGGGKTEENCISS